MKLWVFGDAHVGTDRTFGRESLAEAIRDSEEAFDWDIAIDVGDMSGGQSVPQDDEGEEVLRQLGALRSHGREHIYHLCGNHDRSGLHEPEAWWWRKWIDPLGDNSALSGMDAAKRPYPADGTWERYSVRVGNLLLLLMSDINEPSQTKGRGELGGNPGGVARKETFDWWRGQIERNPDCIILSAHHYVLKNTTVASGEWEGMRKKPDGGWTSHYHGYKAEGTPDGASYLYWVGGKPDAQSFERYLEEHPGASALWLGGHTHTNPDDRCGGKGYQETKWGTHFINCASLTRYHVYEHSVPSSRLLTFTQGSDQVRLQYYLHSDDYRPRGWYEPAERLLKLSRPFSG